MKAQRGDRPTALKTKMKTRVQDTRPVSHAHFDLSTAEIPRKMKMMVSAMLARVFIVYFTVVRDFWEMLASTYLLAPIPQKVILRREKKNHCGTAGGANSTASTVREQNQQTNNTYRHANT